MSHAMHQNALNETNQQLIGSYNFLCYFSVFRYKPQFSRDIIYKYFGPSLLFFCLFFIFFENGALFSTNINLNLFYVWSEHALQSGQHASYTGN